jgi:hypothetical protein
VLHVLFVHDDTLTSKPIPLKSILPHSENLTAERPSFVTHLECAMTGERYAADEPHNLSRAGEPLLVRYDLEGVKRALSKNALARRPLDLWRYRELLPVRRAQDIVSLGEAVTPLVELPRLAAKLGVEDILVKDEGPDRPFKARRWSWPCHGQKHSAFRTWRCRPTAMPDAALAALCESGRDQGHGVLWRMRRR